jgi:hypothetical protein
VLEVPTFDSIRRRVLDAITPAMDGASEVAIWVMRELDLRHLGSGDALAVHSTISAIDVGP